MAKPGSKDYQNNRVVTASSEILWFSRQPGDTKKFS